MRGTAATSAAAIMTVLPIAALIAPIAAPHDPNRQYDPAAGRYLEPGSVRFLVEDGDGRHLLAESVTTDYRSLLIYRLGRTTEIAPASELAPRRSLSRPRFVLGTDRLGRDCLSRLLHAGRISMLVALFATLTAGIVGTAVGAVAGYAGGLPDLLLMRSVDVLLSFPQLIVVILGASLLDAGPTGVAVIIAATTWMPLARIVRSETRTTREREFVTAAIAIGCSPARILWRHLLPHVSGPAAVTVVMAFGDVILLESALSFLGLGSSPETPSWGRMIADGMFAPPSAWWVATFPALALVASVLTVNLGAEAILRRVRNR